MNAEPGRVDAMLAILREALSGAVDNPRLEAELLLAEALGCARSHLHAHPERSVPASRQQTARALARRRHNGEPLAYVLGRREFWSLELVTTPAALVPRPDTERLVELALERAPTRGAVADLGTGSGAIALALAHTRPDLRVVATDADPQALALARTNARRLGLQARIEFREGAWYVPLQGERFDLIVSNPPYLATDDPHLGRDGLTHEPHHALVAGPQGLEQLAVLVQGAPRWLTADGWLLLEHGDAQGGAVAGMLRDRGFRDVCTWQDLAGRDRVSGGRHPDCMAAAGLGATPRLGYTCMTTS